MVIQLRVTGRRRAGIRDLLELAVSGGTIIGRALACRFDHNRVVATGKLLNGIIKARATPENEAVVIEAYEHMLETGAKYQLAQGGESCPGVEAEYGNLDDILRNNDRS